MYVFIKHGESNLPECYARVLIKSINFAAKRRRWQYYYQQVAKKFCFGREEQFFLSTPINKIGKIFIARRLESIYDKEDVLFCSISYGIFLVKIIYGIEKGAGIPIF